MKLKLMGISIPEVFPEKLMGSSVTVRAAVQYKKNIEKNSRNGNRFFYR